jgi:hypothetical protein
MGTGRRCGPPARGCATEGRARPLGAEWSAVWTIRDFFHMVQPTSWAGPTRRCRLGSAWAAHRAGGRRFRPQPAAGREHCRPYHGREWDHAGGPREAQAGNRLEVERAGPGPVADLARGMRGGGWAWGSRALEGRGRGRGPAGPRTGGGLGRCGSGAARARRVLALRKALWKPAGPPCGPEPARIATRMVDSDRRPGCGAGAGPVRTRASGHHRMH